MYCLPCKQPQRTKEHTVAGLLPQNRGNKSTHRTGATVSRRLRAADFNISPAARKHRHAGMFVSAQGDHCSVWIDLDLDARNERVMGEVVETLRTWTEVTDIDVRNIGGAQLVHFTYRAERRRGACA